MKSFIYAIKELQTSIKKICIFDTLLNTAIIFLAAYLISAIMNINRVLALLPPTAYIISALKARENNILKTEAKYSTLKEKLRTAVDNIYLENKINQELQTEVINELKTVEEAAFFNEKKTFTKSAVIIALCILIALSAQFNFKGISLNMITDRIADIKFTTQQEEMPQFAIGGPRGAGTTPAKEIFGKKTVAKLGTEEIKVKINPIGYELNVREVQAPEEKEFNEQFPTDISAQAADTYEENIPKDQQVIVRNYFTKIAEG